MAQKQICVSVLKVNYIPGLNYIKTVNINNFKN